jgi:hypothetical protein
MQRIRCLLCGDSLGYSESLVNIPLFCPGVPVICITRRGGIFAAYLRGFETAERECAMHSQRCSQPTYEDLMRHIGVLTGVKPLEVAANRAHLCRFCRKFRSCRTWIRTRTK